MLDSHERDDAEAAPDAAETGKEPDAFMAGPSAGYMTAEEAADLLGVSVQTLYVYVGRKGIRSQEVSGTRKRRYWRPDVERVMRGARALVPAAAEFKPGTAITLITEQDVFYRGRSALDLAEEGASFETVAAILWGMNEPSVFEAPPQPSTPLLAKLASLLKERDDVDRATALFPILEDANPRAFDLTPEGMARTGAHIVRWLAALAVGSEEPPAGPIHEFIAARLKRGAAEADLVRHMLILSADHGFEPGTVAVRAVASTGVTPWRSVIAGLSISFGRRARLGEVEATRRLLQEIEASTDPGEPVIRRIKNGEDLPGFASPVYAHGDPRGRGLIRACANVLAGDQSFVKLEQALTVVRDTQDREPNFALASLFVLERLGVGARSALFHLGRSAGWIAHSIEQYQAGEMRHRPELYLGALPR